MVRDSIIRAGIGVAAPLALAILLFREADSIPDLRHTGGGYDPATVHRLVAMLDSVGRVQTPPRKARLLLRAAELWVRYGIATVNTSHLNFHCIHASNTI